MSAPTEQLRIKKLRTDPYLAWPQFDRYLTGAQLKVVNCLLRYGANQARAFPANERIAWETSLDEGTVRNTKVQLQRLGVLTKTETMQGNRVLWVYTVDTTWNRERYQAEFEERYRPQKEGDDKERSIKGEIGRLQQALSNASPKDMLAILERIKALTLQMQGNEQEPPAPPKPAQSQPAEPEEDGFVDYIVSQLAQQTSVRNRHGYKSKIKRLLAAGQLEGEDEYRRGYEQQKTQRAITRYLKRQKARVNISGVEYGFDGTVRYDRDGGRYMALFGGHDVVITPETVEAALTSV